MEREQPWWERGIIYQIYPRSFMDSNGDGIGDLAGIASKLDYLDWLGVDILWLCPFYPSPMADFGYDVSDFTGVDPIFGTLADFHRLLAEAHRRGLRVILDFVPNHTSDRHPWFAESLSSRESRRRDWYIWRDPAARWGPPNNWLSTFGGSAWELDPKSGQFYLHTYLREQPDLNWRNPEVREAMFANMRFWLDRGVDGFRLDALWHIVKDEGLRDNPPNPDYRPGWKPYQALRALYCGDRPEIHQLLRRMREMVDAYGDRLLVGELYLPIDRLVNYYGSAERPEIHLPTNFHLITTPWRARAVAATIDRSEAALPSWGWPHFALGNHDRPRLASRTGEGQTRVAAMLLAAMRGTPSLYYGDELGMPDVPVQPKEVKDPWERNCPGRGLGRDPVRSPMPWDGSENAGFSRSRPWLPLVADWRFRSVAAQRSDPRSLLNLYRRLIALRRQEPALHGGTYRPIPAGGDFLLFVREAGGRQLLIALNFRSTGGVCRLRGDTAGRILVTTSLDREGERFRGRLEMRGNEGVIAEITADH